MRKKLSKSYLMHKGLQLANIAFKLSIMQAKIGIQLINAFKKQHKKKTKNKLSIYQLSFLLINKIVLKLAFMTFKFLTKIIYKILLKSIKKSLKNNSKHIFSLKG